VRVRRPARRREPLTVPPGHERLTDRDRSDKAKQKTACRAPQMEHCIRLRSPVRLVVLISAKQVDPSLPGTASTFNGAGNDHETLPRLDHGGFK
jgi:hypothetical protein